MPSALLRRYFQRITYCRVRFLANYAKAKRKKPEVKLRKWRPVIGLEIHAQINTNSKLFSGAGTEFAAPINSQVAYLDAALPGTLPVINRRCVEAGVLTAFALNCEVNLVSKFDRKHYFYADLPAGYQITQQREPIAKNGIVKYIIYNPGVSKKPVYKEARIIQLQLEQDSGKSLHDPDEGHSLIDLNRAGMGLMEIVTAPDFHSAAEAAAFVKELQLILKSLGTCQCNMAEGNLRVDANVSVNQQGEPLGVRSEVKNLNSIRYVSKAIEYEIERHIGLLEAGQEVINETRSFDFETGETIAMRDKEKIQDYRFMPEPNLPPLHLYTTATVPSDLPSDQVINIDELQEGMPELPEQKRSRLQEQYSLSVEHSVILVNDDSLSAFFEEVMAGGQRAVKPTINLMLNELLGILNKKEIDIQDSCITSSDMGEIVDMLSQGEISTGTAKKVLHLVVEGETKTPRQVVVENDWLLITDPEQIRQLAEQVLSSNQKAVKQYKSGKKKVFHFLVGQVLRESNGKMDPQLTSKILQKLLDSPEE